MRTVQFGIRSWGYTAVEYALGIGAIAVVVEIAKLM
jgi:Flp pilus assembly pilin Flp